MSDNNLTDRLLLELDDDTKSNILVLGNCDPRVLVEYIIHREEKKLAHMRPGRAKQNVVAHEVKNDIRYCLNDRLDEVSRWEDVFRFPSLSNPRDLSDKVEQKRMDYEEMCKNGEVDEDEDGSDVPIPEVDMPVALGGNSRLHIAVKDGDMEEVLDLVENLGAKTDNKDHSGWTPYDVARQRRDRVEIAQYLEDHPH